MGDGPMQRGTITIVEETRGGHILWRFRCSACGRTSALHSTVDLTRFEAWEGTKSHARYRCPAK